MSLFTIGSGFRTKESNKQRRAPEEAPELGLRLRLPVKESLFTCNGLDLLNSFAPTVIEGPLFAGATHEQLREHFKTWAASDFQQQGSHIRSIDIVYAGRYRYFIAVDQQSLESVLNARERSPSRERTGYVPLVRIDWEREGATLEIDPVTGEKTYELHQVEGYQREDEGWAKVAYEDVQFQGYMSIQDGLDWKVFYKSPPKLVDISHRLRDPDLYKDYASRVRDRWGEHRLPQRQSRKKRSILS
ncbi:hypothetical protein BDW74DRAFT_176337 [Aspergillus multicolor]|uniref:uncharacterized protein n=1 Tax=Aspergillus multicolor TaxID=41759 RepID=UPI003CCCD43E